MPDTSKETKQDDSYTERSDAFTLKAFETARAELLQRIVLWDGAFVIYLASIGAYLNLAFNYHFSVSANSLDVTKSLALAIPLPFLCLIFTLMILQHHIFIGGLGAYLSNELEWNAGKGTAKPHWDVSKTVNQIEKRLFRVRLITQAVIMVLPIGYGMLVFWILWNGRTNSKPEVVALIILFCLNAFFAVLILWLHVIAGRGPKILK
jgi:hypothetical protein